MNGFIAISVKFNYMKLILLFLKSKVTFEFKLRSKVDLGIPLISMLLGLPFTSVTSSVPKIH